jgi:hypothetical protein
MSFNPALGTRPLVKNRSRPSSDNDGPYVTDANLAAPSGIARYDGLTFATHLLVVRGYDATAGRGIYEFRQPPRDQVDDLASRWQMEVSVRYRF